MIILSLVERSLAGMRRAILSVPEKAGAVEVRLDALPEAGRGALAGLFRNAPRPLVAACRRRVDGGFFRGSETTRVQALWEAIRAGATYVDVEHGSPAAALAREVGGAQGVGVILSHHDRAGMPRDPQRLYRRMASTPGARAVKIVGTARRPADLLRARDLLRDLAGADPPVISFCMGVAGVLSRVMALQWGSWATYASAGPDLEAAPGQLSLADLIGMYRVEEIDEETRLTGLLGRPLGHSLSPAIHNAAYRADELNFRYVPIEVPTPAGLGDLREVARRLGMRGFSVTTPYKLAVLRHLDCVEPLATRIGAVNTIVCDGERLVGLNTDASGGFSALRERLAQEGLSPAGLTMAVVGSGGAARALAHAASAAGASVIVASRSAVPGRRLAREVGGRRVPMAGLARQRYDVLIHCTPLGMQGSDASRLSLPSSALKGRLIYDVVYRPESTALLLKARRKGLATLGGLEMLVRQAAEQYALFTGRDAPLEAMREAARMGLEAAPRLR